MSLATFKGGAHPYEGKALSENCAIQQLDFDGDFVFPMSQHIGAPAKPVVAKGDHVLAGQVIGEAGGFISANVLSSVSGTVKAVEPRMQVGGSPVLSVVVESDGTYEMAEGVGTKRDYKTLSKDEIRAIVKAAGIVGIGGAGFPTSVKLMPKNDAAIDYFIANGSECEPFLTSDYRLMLEEGEKIIGGMEVCLSLFPNAKGVIGIENNKPEAIQHMKELCKGHDRIEVKELLTKYPEGGERQLINAVTGRYINSGMLPADAGCIVQNVATILAIYDAVCEGTPLMQKVITISGDAVSTPANVRVRLGASYAKILEAVGGLKTPAKKTICGGPMMGQALFELDCPVTKPSSALCAFADDEVADNPTTPCIRCGRCVSVCPEFLIPPLMLQAATHGDLVNFEDLNGMECIECGSCSYICPASRPLTQSFKQARKMVMAKRRQEAEEKKLREQHEAEAKKQAEAKAAEEARIEAEHEKTGSFEAARGSMNDGK